MDVSALQWPALQVETRAIRDLVLSDENPRTHTLEQIELISDSMEEFGWTIPVVVDEENGVLAGHGRVRAARLKGWDVAPVVVARGWTDAQKRAYLVIDNRLAERSAWDKKSLQSTLRQLQAAEFDMELVGFSADDLNKLIIDRHDSATTEAGPTEVVMNRCPACGRLSRKLEESNGKV